MAEVSNKTPDPMDVALGAAVRIRRRTIGMSQEALAEQCGVSFQQIQKYENGANRISFSRLVQIARAYDLPLEAVVAAAAESAASKGAVELATRNVRPDTAEAAIALARSWPDLNPEQISAIRRVIEEGR